MKRVLVVDDAVFMRVSIKNMLEGSGFSVVAEAANGLEAIKQFAVHKPDIVTMDITMPEMGGIEALREILLSDSSAKVVMVSAMGQSSMIMEAIMCGAKYFIVKPFKAEQVLQVLNSIE